MDKNWMKETNRLGKRYIEGVKQFLNKARGFVDSKNQIRCPCLQCRNVYF